ncbi:MAG: hypothetical protein J5746_07560 [Victivallales bacterium]|nr:hypothetical protein [Victivallales bacterium]
MLFVDTKPSWKSIALLVTLSLLVFMANISLPQLRRSDEALNAAYALEMAGDGFAETALYGVSVPGYPLYPWLVKICSLGGIPTTFALRLPAFIALAIIAIASGIFALKLQSSFAGIIASCIVMLSVVSFKIGILANVDIVASCLISCAWYLLYIYGWSKRQWGIAWTIALALVFICTFGWGLKAVLIFYLPMFFLWNRLDGFETLQSSQHIVSALVALALMVARYFVFPNTPLLPWKALAFVNPPETFADYIWHLVGMLPKTAFYLLPWTLLSWAPFCLALRQFELHRTACHYLRVIVSSTFVLFLVLPGGSPLHLLPVLGPFAVLMGVHSEIVLRRYRDFFACLLRLVAWLCLIVAVSGVLFWLAVVCNALCLDFVSFKASCFALGCSTVALLDVCFAILFNGGRLSFRTCTLWLILCCSLLYTSLWRLPHAAFQCSARKCAEMLSSKQGAEVEPASALTLREAMEEDGSDTLYLAMPQLLDVGTILVENFYLRMKIRYVKDMQTDLPPDCKVAYVLSPFIPAVQQWEWKAFSPNVPIGRKRTLQIDFKGMDALRAMELPLLELRALDEEPLVLQNYPELRIYRGTLKEKSVALATQGNSSHTEVLRHDARPWPRGTTMRNNGATEPRN